MINRPQARSRVHHGKSPVGRMNKTEGRYAELLEGRRLAGEIYSWRYEPIRLRLGDDWKTTYTPDFEVILPDGLIELHEIKGGAGFTKDARVKIKVAARLYPQFRFIGIQYRGTRIAKREEF